MKARIPKHREFIIDFPQDMDQARADEGWNKLNEIVEEYKKAHNGQTLNVTTITSDAHFFTKNKSALITFYICENCGYIEEYLDQDEIVKLK